MSGGKRAPPLSKKERSEPVEQFNWHAIGMVVAQILGWFPETGGLLAPYHTATVIGDGSESKIDLGLRRLEDVAAMISRHVDLKHLDSGTPDGQAAENALDQLTQVIECGFASPKVKKFLPIFIAAISRTPSTVGRHAAKHKRPKADRRGYLRRVVEDFIKTDTDESTIYILNSLIAKGKVRGMKDDRVLFNGKESIKSVGYDHFENICVQARKAKHQTPGRKHQVPSIT